MDKKIEQSVHGGIGWIGLMLIIYFLSYDGTCGCNHELRTVVNTVSSAWHDGKEAR
jgi:hypothetical protein